MFSWHSTRTRNTKWTHFSRPISEVSGRLRTLYHFSFHNKANLVQSRLFWTLNHVFPSHTQSNQEQMCFQFFFSCNGRPFAHFFKHCFSRIIWMETEKQTWKVSSLTKIYFIKIAMKRLLIIYTNPPRQSILLRSCHFTFQRLHSKLL